MVAVGLPAGDVQSAQTMLIAIGVTVCVANWFAACVLCALWYAWHAKRVRAVASAVWTWILLPAGVLVVLAALLIAAHAVCGAAFTAFEARSMERVSHELRRSLADWLQLADTFTHVL
jgi:hypothetical protein